jgi:D-alanyl-lipoteichoic acid acyltransferase DltB (MBOAT superfamily)
MFYPQLVAGPIERPQNILHQFYEKHDFDYARVMSGLQLMAWGFFKKVVIADRLSVVVDAVYNQPDQYGALPVVCATVLFAIQIYCDFSGYSDIALGSARVMGFQLMRNFRSPYLSRSVSEFWTRWHISLSTWFRDYVYIPLGGNRVARWRWYTNLLITFLVSGLWHGANWTYVIWGGLNGLYIVLETAARTTKKSTGDSLLMAGCKTLFTFALICSTWLFFRANSVQDAQLMISHIFSDNAYQINGLQFISNVLSNLDLLVLALSIVLLFAVEFSEDVAWNWVSLQQQSTARRILIYYSFLLLILLFGKFQINEQFIYFQF